MIHDTAGVAPVRRPARAPLLAPLVLAAAVTPAVAFAALAVAEQLTASTAAALAVVAPLPVLLAVAFERARARHATLRGALLGTLLFMLVGYAVFNRTFSYLGVPPLNLFIGELVIVGSVVLLPVSLGDAVRRLAARAPLLVAALGVWLTYGTLEAARGVALGYGFREVLRQFAFHYYLVYIVLGAAAGESERAERRVYAALRWVAWLTAVYGVASLGFLFRFESILLPGTSNTSLFPQIAAAGSSPTVMSVLALTCLGDRVARSSWERFGLLAVNLAVLLGVQVRQDYLALLVSLAVWALLTRRDRLGPAFRVAGVAFALIAAAWIADVKVPSGRGPIGAREVIVRVISAVSRDSAENFSSETRNVADVTSDTVEWRTKWWGEILDHAFSDPRVLVVGEGYGFQMWTLVDYVAHDVWTSHSVFFDTLGRLGFLGVLLFALAFVAALAAVLNAARREPGTRPLRVMIVAYAVGFYAGAHFFNGFGSPFGAIPLFTLVGLGLSSLGHERAAVSR